MNDQTDSQLLRAYVQSRSESAFAELVRRHVDLVYSAALRMVCDSHLAQDVSQAVFVALAKNAGQLTDRPILSGWLHKTAQNIAAQTVRTDVRRRVREQEAVAMNELLSNEPNASWEEIAPHLDAGLGELSDSDRDAITLRFFERKSAREMAQRLNITEDAAQKRVNRAVDRLREFFSKRGVAVGASGLVVVISSNAIQAAPIGLAVTISASAALTGTLIQTSTAIAATKTIAMTTLQKTLITATVLAAIGVGFYEERQNSNLRTEVNKVQQLQAPLKDQIQQLQQERDETVKRLTILTEQIAKTKGNSSELLWLRGEVGRLRVNASQTNDPFVQKALRWKANEARLRQLFNDRPDQRVPEMQFLPDDAWLDLARDEDLNSEDGIRKALSGVRRYAKNIFVNELSDALGKYVEKNNGRLPDNVTELKSYFKTPVDDAVLLPYKLLHTGKLSDVPRGEWVMTDTVVDDKYDTPQGIGPGSFGPMRASQETVTALVKELDSAFKSFSAANNGNAPVELEQLLPYINTPSQTNALEQLDRMGVRLGGK